MTHADRLDPGEPPPQAPTRPHRGAS
jgi:hypothetical protein